MKLYRKIFIFIMLIIISFCTSETLEQLRRDLGPFCRNNTDCDMYDKCIDRQCHNSCYDLNCRSGEGCFVNNHIASCQCLPGFAHNSDHSCAKICIFDSDCGEHATCHDDGKIRKCQCLPGFVMDTFPNGICRWKCSQDSDCASGSKCKHGRCIDPCDGVKCTPNEHCVMVLPNLHEQCQCLKSQDADANGRCP